MRLVYSLIVAVTRGVNYALLDKLLINMPIIILCLGCSLLNSLFFGIIFFLGKYNLNFKKYFQDTHTIRLFILVTVLFLIGNALILVAIKNKNATVASLIEISYPIFVVIFSYLLFKNTNLNTGTIFGGLLIIAGVILVYLANK
ncbi:MAG: EamA family transporter [Candidatus Absconditabacterales bacterium]